MSDFELDIQLNHELSLIKSFVIIERQQRYIELLSTQKGRTKFRSYIAHFKDLNSQFCFELPIDMNQAGDLYTLLKSKGASDTCYIMSPNSTFDRKTLPLKEAINILFLSGNDFFISCLPEKLAYFEGEDIKSRYLLQK